MRIVVLVKQVPDTYGERRLRPDGCLDRGAGAVADEIDERAVEVALTIRETTGGDITALTMGPERALESLRKALAMGADRAVHVCDAALAGSDALQTSAVLAAALRTVEFDLIIAGNESTDGRTAAIPAMLAERLALPQLTWLSAVAVQDGVVTGTRTVEDGTVELRAALPALVSVTEQIAQPRHPSFTGIMGAKKKPLTTLSIADLGIRAEDAGGGNSRSRVRSVTARPARISGTVIADDGTAATRLAEFLAAAKLI